MLRPSPLQATRATQPHRKGRGRQPGPSLDAMLKGEPLFLPNPMQLHRGTLRQRKRRTLADRMTGGR